MLSKNEAKYIQSLYHKKTREEEKVFIAEGEKIINELLQSNFKIVKLYAVEDWLMRNQSTHTIIPVTNDELKKISGQQNPNRVLAVVKQPKDKPLPILQNMFSLLLDGIQDPGNLGTIIRIADWFGISNIITGKETADLYNPKVIQATMGSFIRVNVFYEDDLEKLLTETNIPVYGAMLDGEDVHSVKKVSNGILIIGNEGSGIRPGLVPLINRKITIQKGNTFNVSAGGAESLNAAVATGIILSHLA